MAEQTLQLQIGYDASQAERGLDSLARSLEKIKRTISAGLNFQPVTGSLQSFTDKLRRAVPNDTIKKLERLAEALKTVQGATNAINTEKLRGLNIGGSGRGASQTPLQATMATSSAQVQSTAEGVQKAAENAQAFANNMATAKQEIQQCKISIDNTVRQPGTRRMVEPREHDRFGFFGRRYGTNPEAVRASEALGSVNEKVEQVKHNVQLTTEQAQALADSFVNSTGKVEQLAFKIADAKAKLGQGIADGSMSGSQMADSAARIQKMQEELARLQDTAGSSGESTNRFSDGVKTMREVAGKALKPLTGLVGQFGRLLRYRILRNVIKEIGEAFTVGLENVRKYSEAINGLYAREMTALDNSLLKMKNSIGASLAVAFQQLIPIIQQVVSWVITAVNYINQFIALITGAKTWTRAVDVSASSTDKAAKAVRGVGSAAKDASDEMKNLLASWDELNIIQSKTSKSGSGGGGGVGGAADELEQYKKMFTQDANFAPWIRNLAENFDKIKQLAIGIGAAILAWKIGSQFATSFGQMLRIAIGIGAVVWGVQMQWKALTEQLRDGITWENLKQNVFGALLVIGGLGMVFGRVAFGIGLVLEGALLMVPALKELIETGDLSEQAFVQLESSIGMVGIGLTVLTRSAVPLAAAGMVGLAIAIVHALNHPIETVEKLRDLVSSLPGHVKQNLVDSPVFNNDIVSGYGDWAAKVGNTIADGINKAVKSIQDGSFFTDMLEGIKTGLTQFVSWFDRNVRVPVVNFFIDIANFAINAINAAIDGINSMLNWNIELPDWIPQEWLSGMGIEGRSLSLSVGEIPRIETIAHITALELDEEAIDSVEPATNGRGRRRNITGTAVVPDYVTGGIAPSVDGTVAVSGDVSVNNMSAEVATGTAQGNKEQNDLLRTQNQLLRQLLNKEFTARMVPTASTGRTIGIANSRWESVAGISP